MSLVGMQTAIEFKPLNQGGLKAVLRLNTDKTNNYS